MPKQIDQSGPMAVNGRAIFRKPAPRLANPAFRERLQHAAPKPKPQAQPVERPKVTEKLKTTASKSVPKAVTSKEPPQAEGEPATVGPIEATSLPIPDEIGDSAQPVIVTAEHHVIESPIAQQNPTLDPPDVQPILKDTAGDEIPPADPSQFADGILFTIKATTGAAQEAQTIGEPVEIDDITDLEPSPEKADVPQLAVVAAPPLTIDPNAPAPQDEDAPMNPLGPPTRPTISQLDQFEAPAAENETQEPRKNVFELNVGDGEQQDLPSRDIEANAPVLEDRGTLLPEDPAVSEKLFSVDSRAIEKPVADAVARPALPLEQRFASDNHEDIVTAIRTELPPKGGTVRIRLDPPELGALQVRIELHEGMIMASFETSNEEATRLLSHSLGQLKQMLETHGVTVEKLHVQQGASDNPSSSQEERSDRQSSHQDESSRHEQQRREMLRRMWRRLAGARDPLDLVA